MDKYIKLQSLQGGQFTGSQNIVDFHVPASGVYDLKDSFVQVLCTITPNETVNAGIQAAGSSVYPSMLAWKDANGAATDIHFENSAVVKNAVLDCQNKGRIENLRRVDVFSQNMACYNKEQRTKACEAYMNVNQVAQPIDNEQWGISTHINKEGIDPSSYVGEVPMVVRLSDVFDFADKATEYDTDRAGATRLHLECNFNRLMAVCPFYALAAQQNTETASCVDQAVGENLQSVVIGSFPGAPAGYLPFENMSQNPYYVGQKLKVSATMGGTTPPAGPVNGGHVVIQSIIWDQDNVLTKGQAALVIGFTKAPLAAPLTGDETAKVITLEIVDAASYDVTFDRAELVLKRVMNPVGIDMINYKTYSCEETNGNSLQNFRNIYTVEAKATNVIVFSPNGDDGLLSTNNTVSSHRFSLNNIDLTDRDVVKNSPLYYDRTASALAVAGYGLNNTTQNAGDTAVGFGENLDATTSDIDIMASPLFQTASGIKLLQLQANAGAGGVKALNIYKQIPGEFEY